MSNRAAAYVRNLRLGTLLALALIALALVYSDYPAGVSFLEFLGLDFPTDVLPSY